MIHMKITEKEPSPNGYYFKTQKLTVGYDQKPLIKDIEVSIEKGEILTLIGPNGAGKSTVLKSIARQLEPVSGCVYLEEKELSKTAMTELAKKIAVLFTDKIKSDMLTCEDVVSSGRYPYTGYFGLLSKEDKDIVAETMETVGISDLKDRDFDKISDGQKQRVMLARALCQEPEILLLDEPTSFLDIRHKLEFLSVLEKMRDKRKLTVIMSVHELELAKHISDKVMCLKGEFVDRFDTPANIFNEDYIRELYGIDDTLSEFAKSRGIELCQK